MPHHSVERTSRGNVVGIDGTCGSEECPIEDVDDDGSIEYRCPVTGDVIAEVDAVDRPDTPDDRKPATTDALEGQRRRRRRNRRNRR